MVDFSINDGYFKIEQNSTFSKAIIKELGLSKEESKQMASAWGKIFEIAKREKMGNLDPSDMYKIDRALSVSFGLSGTNLT